MSAIDKIHLRNRGDALFFSGASTTNRFTLGLVAMLGVLLTSLPSGAQMMGGGRSSVAAAQVASGELGQCSSTGKALYDCVAGVVDRMSNSVGDVEVRTNGTSKRRNKLESRGEQGPSAFCNFAMSSSNSRVYPASAKHRPSG